MRPSCYFCARKHISKASIKLQEAQLGYPAHIDLAIGELSEAEDELLELRPDLANLIRTHRKGLEASLSGDPTGAAYRVPIMELLKVCRDTPQALRSPPVAAPVSSVAAIIEASPAIAAVPVAEAPAIPDAPIAAPPAAIEPPPQKGCSPCEEAAKFRKAAEQWRARAASGEVQKFVAVLAPLGDFRPSYSLATVVLDQVRALSLIPSTHVALFVRSGADLTDLPPLPANVEVITTIPNISAGEDQVGETQVTSAFNWLGATFDLMPQGYIFTHDLIFQAWFAHWAKALHLLADEYIAAKTSTKLKFFHWMHSSVGARPTKPEARWRSSVPTGHTMVALNSSDLPYLQRYYSASTESFVSIPNPRDVRVFYGMPKAAVDIVTKCHLHLADVFQLYPLSATRMHPKGVSKVVDIFAALCKARDGILCRLLVADAHANGQEGRTNKELIKRYATKIGLPDGVLNFTSDLVPANDPIHTYGLEATAIRCLFQLANVFIFPTTSEAGSLVLMEAALSGNLLVLNESLPCMADYISSTDAIWVPFGSIKEAGGSWDAATVAGRIEAELSQSKSNLSKRAILRGHSLEAYAGLLLEHVFKPVPVPVIEPDPVEAAIPLRTAMLLDPSPG